MVSVTGIALLASVTLVIELTSEPNCTNGPERVHESAAVAYQVSIAGSPFLTRDGALSALSGVAGAVEHIVFDGAVTEQLQVAPFITPLLVIPHVLEAEHGSPAVGHEVPLPTTTFVHGPQLLRSFDSAT